MHEKYETVITATETVTTNITFEFVKTLHPDADLKLKSTQLEVGEKLCIQYE